MRRLALLLPTLLLPACSYVGSPFVGFGGFVADTHTLDRNATMPNGSSENVQRSIGADVPADPLLPEAGNVWPGPVAPEPTLADIEKQQNQEMQQNEQPRQAPRGSSTPPGNVTPQPRPAPAPPTPTPPPATPPPPGPGVQIYQTPQGPITATTGSNGVQTFIAPGGGTGIVVQNGNGTATLIHPDGTVQTVPTPRR